MSMASVDSSVDASALQHAHDLLRAQDYKAAERAYKQIIDSLDEHHEIYNMVLSAYGLSQVVGAEQIAASQNGLLLCRDAANNEALDGDVFLNLACAEWYSDNRKRAIDALRQGVKIDAENERLNNACRKLGCRRRCCISFLPRSHKVNRFFGRLFRRPEQALTVHHLLF